MYNYTTMDCPIRQLDQNEFPFLLSEITDPPEKLFLRGELPADKNKFLCVVGSRKYSPYGKDVCEKLIAGLAGYNIVIISGLAHGIDSVAHRAALNSGLKTVAIPGSGLNDAVLYPSAHRGLARQILTHGGALLSVFDPDFRATPYSFPERNRIMAGMSHATLIIEAAKKSGTLITSRLATEYNRDVLAVPGSIFSAQSYGPHMLIRLGAIPIRSSDDILEALGIESKERKSVYSGLLTKPEQRVMEFLQTPIARDELIQKLKIKTSDANILLSTMELKGLVEERLGEFRISQSHTI